MLFLRMFGTHKCNNPLAEKETFDVKTVVTLCKPLCFERLKGNYHWVERCSNRLQLYSATCLFTPWSTVLLVKLTVLQLVKKFAEFYGTWKFITVFTSYSHMSISWASLIQSIPPHRTSWKSILILSFHLRLGLSSDLFPSGFPTKTLYMPLPSPSELHTPSISFFSIMIF
jgi:hypothetical protein